MTTFVSFVDLKGNPIEVNSTPTISSLGAASRGVLPDGVEAATVITWTTGQKLTVQGTVAETIAAFTAAVPQAPLPSQIAFTTFDPGVGTPHRWNVAFANAMFRQAVAPYQLLIDGHFVFDQSVAITLPMTIIGNGSDYSKLEFVTKGNSGIHIQLLAQNTSISGILLTGPDPFTGSDIGMLVQGARCTFSNMVVQNWGGIGISVNAAVPTGNGNECTFNKIQFSLCGNSQTDQNGSNAGFYTKSSDANGCLIIACDASDCRRGFYEASFLGNNYIGCSVEACNDRFVTVGPVTGFGFVTEGATNGSVFLAPYMEEDSQSDINNACIIIGGRGSNRGTSMWLKNHTVVEYLGAAGFEYTDPSNNQLRQVGSQIGSTEDGIAHYFAATSEGQLVADIRLRYGMVTNLSNWWALSGGPSDNADLIRFAGGTTWIPHDYKVGLNGNRECVRPSIVDMNPPQDGLPWAVGDRIRIQEPAPNTPSTYRVVAVSGGGVPTLAVESTLGPALP